MKKEELAILALVHEEELLARADPALLVQGGQVRSLPLQVGLAEIWAEVQACGR